MVKIPLIARKTNSVGSVVLSIDKKGSYFGAPETGHLGQSIRKRSPANFPCPETRSEVVDSVSTDFRGEVLGRGNVQSSLDVVLSTPSFARGSFYTDVPMTRWWRCSQQTGRDHGCLITQDISSTCVLEFVDYDGRLSWWSVEKCHHLIRSPGLTIAKHEPTEPCRAEEKCSKIGNNSLTIQFEFRNKKMKHPAQRMRTVRQPLKAKVE